MSYFSEWNEKIVDNTNEKEFNDFVEYYYTTEQTAYDTLFKFYPNQVVEGTAKELAEKLAYGERDMVFFVGFLDGINKNLKDEIDLDNLNDDTHVKLDIDYEKLLYDMHANQASWLFQLDSWDNILDKEKRDEIAHQYRTDNIATSDKYGRNDPCPCGSGKKYKKCHGA